MYSPEAAASSALQNLLGKLETMKTNYSTAMDEFRADVTAQNAYVAGVQYWISMMRSADVRTAISRAVGDAKAKYKSAVEAARAKIAAVPR